MRAHGGPWALGAPWAIYIYIYIYIPLRKSTRDMARSTDVMRTTFRHNNIHYLLGTNAPARTRASRQMIRIHKPKD